jgi:hypothetical protein
VPQSPGSSYAQKGIAWLLYRPHWDTSQVDVKGTNGDGETPIVTASWYGNTEAVAGLIEQGADVNDTNAAGKTPLFAACWRSFPEVAALLLQKGAKIHQVRAAHSAQWACRGTSVAVPPAAMVHARWSRAQQCVMEAPSPELPACMSPPVCPGSSGGSSAACSRVSRLSSDD